MNEKYLAAFKSLANIFAQYNFELYLVGGTSRDFLLNLEIKDMDVATSANPDEIKQILNNENLDTTFERFGSFIYKYDDIKFEITCLRKESKYSDSRHPLELTFVRDIKIDYLRRDFTVNAIYIDKDLKIYDFCDGQLDLKDRTLRMIGNPNLRIKEDPLRIIRALRFMLVLDFNLDAILEEAIKSNIELLKLINPEKIKSELLKMKEVDINKQREIFKRFNIVYLLDMLK